MSKSQLIFGIFDLNQFENEIKFLLSIETICFVI